VATPLLTRAVNLDNDHRFTEALCLYQEGIQILMEALKTFANEDPKKMRIRAKTEGENENYEKFPLSQRKCKTTKTKTFYMKILNFFSRVYGKSRKSEKAY
jgi:hypothetical protein